MDQLTDAQRALFEWLDNNYINVMQALEMAAESNDQKAAGFVGTHAQIMRESAASWRRHAADLRRIYQALPEEGK